MKAQLRRLGWLLLGAWTAMSVNAHAQSASDSPEGTRIFTEGELGAGWLLLPTNQVCASAGCVHGDSSFTFHLAGLAHVHRMLSVGVGGHFAWFPTSHPPLAATATSADRYLSRSYFTFSAEARLYPFRKTVAPPARGAIVPYLGAEVGLFVANDRYRSPPDDDVGALRIEVPGTILHTEGVLARGIVGVDWGLTRHLALGAGLRAGGMWLPGRKFTPFDDQSTMTGGGLNIACTLNFKGYLQI